jgi:hypothetical protein
MDIREFTCYKERLPFRGYGIWIVVEEKNRNALLLHPIHLVEEEFSEYEFRCNVGDSLWPINTTGTGFDFERFIRSFEYRIKYFLENGRQFPVQSVAKALSALKEISMEDALSFIGENSVDQFGSSFSRLADKASREYDIKAGVDIKKFSPRAQVILEDLKEHGPASIHKITHRVDGKLKTKTPLGRVVTYFVNQLTTQGALEIVA